MWNTGLDEATAGVKIARRNINNLRYADDTIFTAECEDELKSLLMKVKVVQSCPALCDTMDYIACQSPLSMELSRTEYWSV